MAISWNENSSRGCFSVPSPTARHYQAERIPLKLSNLHKYYIQGYRNIRFVAIAMKRMGRRSRTYTSVHFRTWADKMEVGGEGRWEYGRMRNRNVYAQHAADAGPINVFCAHATHAFRRETVIE